MIKIKTSYFYQIRNFTPNLIPVSVCLSDPTWYKPPEGQEYYIDKRGIVCGLRYEPLIVQRLGTCSCPSPPCCEYAEKKIFPCPTMVEYRQLLNTIDYDRTIKAFEFCSNKFKKELGFNEEPIIVLMVHEALSNPCSERYALQEYFKCEEIVL